MNINDHIRDNPFAIVRGYVPLAGIIDNLKNKYHAVDMPTDDIPNLWMHRFNAVNLPSNETRRLTESQLQIKAIKIPITQETKHYTEKDYRPIYTRDGTEADYMYLAYEEKLRYLYSNSNILFLETVLARGIPEEAIENKTEDYICYLDYLKHYLEYGKREIDEK